jgi:hypothetical protein
VRQVNEGCGLGNFQFGSRTITLNRLNRGTARENKVKKGIHAALVFLFLIPLALSQGVSQVDSKRENTSTKHSTTLPTIAEKTVSMRAFPGFFIDYWDEREGKLWLRIDKWNTPFLFYESLPDGVGANDIGLDRGQPGSVYVAHFERSGPRVLLVAENQEHRAVTDDADQRRAIREAFAESVLWGFKIEAEDGGAVLVDATAMFLSDAHQVSAKLAATKQGSFELDSDRSAIYLPSTRNFPENTDVESILTFRVSGDKEKGPGEFVKEVTPNPRAITVHEHFSFIQSPPAGFRSRDYDPRSGYFNITYMDFATPVDEPIVKRKIARFRLAKKDQSASVSAPVKPIVYYVDRAIPEPIRSAVVEGASWWNQAFTTAGYKDAFKVELLPEGVDPMDVRYNVIEWTPRATRGWSYGTAVVDPRTGEIINGHVNLDALRIRQVFLIAQGLLDPFGKNPEALAKANAMALARIRQLSAHETGHTLGLMHNFVGSILNRASVMDYPAPKVTLDANGSVDVSDAYAVGIGAWDKVTIAYGYSDFSPGTNELNALDKILNEASSNGLLFLTDQDARPLGSASPVTHLWDTGSDDVEGLKQVMAVREAALGKLSEDAIRMHTPAATLEDVLVPVYLYHRYQVVAVAKSIGGLNYTFNLRGSSEKNPEIVPAQQQRNAIHAVLDTLSPQVLAVPQSLLEIIPPRPPDYPASHENFASRTSPAFDALAPAEAAAEIVASVLFQPERDERMIEYHARSAENPGFDELVDNVLAATWKAPAVSGYSGAVQRTVNAVVLAHLSTLAGEETAPDQVREIALLKLEELKKWLGSQEDSQKDTSTRAEFFFAQSQIAHFEENPTHIRAVAPAQPPAGDPIGADDADLE